MRVLRMLDKAIRTSAIVYIALALALGGTAFAAATIGSDGVTDNSLKSIDLKNGKGVKGEDVVPNSLTGDQIDESTLLGVGSSSIVARARGSTGQDSTVTPTDFPMNNTTWTQTVDQSVTDALVKFQFDVGAGSCDQFNYQKFVVEVDIDGVQFGTAFAYANIPVATDQVIVRRVAQQSGELPLFEPAVPTLRQVTAKISDNCDGAIHVDSVAVNVIGLS